MPLPSLGGGPVRGSPLNASPDQSRVFRSVRASQSREQLLAPWRTREMSALPLRRSDGGEALRKWNPRIRVLVMIQSRSAAASSTLMVTLPCPAWAFARLARARDGAFPARYFRIARYDQVASMVRGALIALVSTATFAGLGCAKVIVHPFVDTSARVNEGGQTASVTVSPGDSLYGIALRHGVNAQSLAYWNQIVPPYTIYPGQILQLVVSDEAAEAEAWTDAGRGLDAGRGGETYNRLSAASASRFPKSSHSSSHGGLGHAGSWRPPVEEARVDTVRSTSSSLHLLGTFGSSVLAAQDGVVLYSGSGSPGYEELIVILHDDNWMSSYSYNHVRLVGEGKRVKAGDPIASMGRMTDGRGVLRFELRHNGIPVDPRHYLSIQ